MFGSLQDSQATAHIRAMRDPAGGQLGRDVYRGYGCFDSGDCNNLVARLGRITSTNLLLGAEAESS